MVSIIIPALNEKYLEKTIRNVLSMAQGEIEVIVLLDGYIPNPQIVINDNRVRFIHHEKTIGQRQSVNEGARLAKGKYIMKLDAHCALNQGFDVKLAQDCEYDWTVVPRMYNLDVDTFEPKFHKRTDYMYITSPTNEKPFRAMYYGRQPDTTKLIDDTMCCMGPGWFMHKDRYWELGGMDEMHGGWGQMGIEVACKAWLSGGSLKVNKKTWFAHWFRGDVGFPYEMSGKAVERARKYSQELWLNNKWHKQTRKFEWMVEKFSPPTWNTKSKFPELYNWIFDKEQRNYPRWKGNKVIKFPTDMILYAQAIWENKPDIIIELGTAYGGSTLFLADMLELTGKGKVISIDVNPVATPQHPRVEYITGRTTAVDTLEKVKSKVGGSCMVICDSDHRRVHVKRELFYYSPLVTKGQYIVVEDCYYDNKKKPPAEAVDWFIKSRIGKDFKLTDIDKQFCSAITRGGWLRRQR
jgi:cephalosporin hydroxylase